MTQAYYEGLPWKIHRGRKGWPRWWQRWYEAWLVVTGRYTFWHAFDEGKLVGSMREYHRIIGNGGDLVPVIHAAIYETFREAVNGEPSEEFIRVLSARSWSRFKERPNVLVSSKQGSD